MTQTSTGDLVLTQVDAQFTADLLGHMFAQSADASNRIQEFTEQDRNEAQETLVAFYDAIESAHYDSPVQVRAIGIVLKQFAAQVASANQSIEFRSRTS